MTHRLILDGSGGGGIIFFIESSSILNPIYFSASKFWKFSDFFFSTFFKYIFWISHMFSPLSWLYKESAFFIIKLRIWGIQILFVLDLRLRLNRVLKSQKSPEVRSSSSPIKILFPYSSAWIKYHLCILQICIMLIHELCPKGLKKSVQQTRSTFL